VERGGQPPAIRPALLQLQQQQHHLKGTFRES
jgi:hypothetical protein